MLNGRVWERFPGRLGRVRPVLAVDVIKPLGTIIEGGERLIRNGPCWRDATQVLELAEVLAP